MILQDGFEMGCMLQKKVKDLLVEASLSLILIENDPNRRIPSKLLMPANWAVA